MIPDKSACAGGGMKRTDRAANARADEAIEAARAGRGRIALRAALLSGGAFMSLVAFAPAALANPEGGAVVGGAATISESSGKILDVRQSTDRVVIDWRSFDIDADEQTAFHQPSSDAIALNRVKSADPSRILGRLSANGNVILVNPNGVFFGKDSVVDVNGLVATTADIDTKAFMSGGNHFNIPGDPEAAIVNEGAITAREAGLVGLVAPNVENRGVITARLGRVHLASGDTVTADFYGDGLLKVEVIDERLKSQFVGNSGVLEAEGGTVAMTAAAAREAINSLIVVKGELKAPTVEEREGKIIIAAAGSNKTDKTGESSVIVRASLDASGRDAGERGGSIEILGDHVALLGETALDASGHSAPPVPMRKPGSGTATLTADKTVRSEEDFMEQDSRAGGSIKVGGDYLGGGDTQTAKTLYVGADVLALNDAIESGDAGRTIFWSDDTTEFDGLVLARGGESGGNGGFLETSGKINLLANGFADLSAQADGYAKGSYLLDPQTITIYGNVDPKFVSTDGTLNLNSSLVLWLDGNDLDGDGVAEGLGESGLVNGVANCGTNITCVATWVDKSGHANNATQGTAASRPEFVIGGQNGLDILRFDGADRIDSSGISFGSFFISGMRQANSEAVWFEIPAGNERAFTLLASQGAQYITQEISYLNSMLVQQTINNINYTGGVDNTALRPITYNTQLIESGYDTMAVVTNTSVGFGYATPGWVRLIGTINEFIDYSNILSTNARNLVEQYQSAKWGIALDHLAGAGTEIAEATAHNAGNPTDAATNGYNVFTTRYLERLAGSADLMLQAASGITLDLKGDTLDLTGGGAAGKSITLKTDNGSITDVSSGTIRTTHTGSGAGLNGNISIIAGGTGSITLDTTNLEALNGGAVSLTAGGSVTASGISGGSVFLQSGAGADVTLDGAVTATGAGNALTIAAGRNFINNAGAGALNASNAAGRWLVYSASPSANMLGGLSADFKRYGKTYAGYAPAAVAESGDGFLYSVVPNLTVRANDVSRVRGQDNPALTYSYSGLIGGDSLSDVLGVLPVLVTSAGPASIEGTYAITTSGALSSVMGYTVGFTPGTLTVTSAVLPSSWEGVAYAGGSEVSGAGMIGPLTGGSIFDPGGFTPTRIVYSIGKERGQGEDSSSESEGAEPSSGPEAMQGRVRVLNITIEAALARALGLSPETLREMFL